ncbi:hypothetical protein KAR91_60230 [Candidatus Pacearchaeota archaeon]|nr:hypothetical protein [Candidatus Pacearchaeota archaeon]
MKFKVTTSKEALAESGSSYMSTSGVYDVTVKFASVDVSKNGAESVNFNVDYNGNDQTIYGPYVTNTNGDVNEIGSKLINKLAVISGMGDGDDFSIEQEEHIVGKDKKAQEFSTITNFSDVALKMRLQEEYSRNQKTNEIRKQMVIKSFFREDGASAEEIINETEVGKRLATEVEKYAANITYKDNITAEDVEAWKKSKASNASSRLAPQAKAASTAKTATVFR